MAFVLGIWMWNRYFTPKIEYAPGTEHVALVKIDRDLRLADAMEKDPAWLRKLVGSRSRGEITHEALESLAKLEAWQAMGPEGIQAYLAIQATQRDRPVPLSINGLDLENDPRLNRPTWWRAKKYEQLEESGSITGSWREAYQASLRDLRSRAIGLSSVMMVFVLVGVIFLPMTILRLTRGLREKPVGYAAAWSPALGLTVFMVATLAWIGYVGTLDLGIEKIVSLPAPMAILLDTAARLLPALIAMGFLFKRPSHAFRVLGLDRAPDFRLIFGMFSLLLLADFVQRAFMGNPGLNEPGGGLSVGDIGVQGLVFALISACIVAPVTEEIVYRGVLFRSLANRTGVLAGAAVSAVVFSAIHFYDLQGFVSVAVFGFACALLYAATGSLSTVIALHVLYNFSIKIPAWIFYHAKLDG